MVQQKLNKFFDLLIYSNYFIAICAGLICLQILVGVSQVNSITLSLFLFVFFSTHFSYNAHRLWGFKPKDISYLSQRQHWHNNHLVLQFTSTLFSAIACILVAFYISIEKLLIILPAAIISILYNVQFFKFSLRSIPFLKLFLIAFSWAYTSTVFPLFVVGNQFSTAYLLLEFTRSFLFIVAITIPFDIRDLHFDEKHLKTIPQLLGIEKSKWLSTSILLSILIIDLLLQKNHYFVADILTFVFCLFLIKESSPYKSDKYYLLGLDGMIILQSVLVLLVYKMTY